MTQNQDAFTKLFTDWLLNEKKLDHKVVYEYARIAFNFTQTAHIDTPTDNPERRKEEIQEKVKAFLDLENPHSYRNNLAALKKLFEFIGESEVMAGFKYKAIMPTFSIQTPSLDDMVKFGRAIENERIRVYYYLGVVSAIRPEHLLRLRKKLFDKNNNMINTWMKTFGKKNFFFSFYTSETKPLIEEYLNTIPDNEVLFPIGKRYICKEFEKASTASGVKIVPKMMRKFSTNWLRRHGMISEDVDVITSQVPQSVVAKNYLDVSRIHESYNEATEKLKIL
jgi:integrase